tara:strand:- start:88 stop:576 length:489 start_codon:yes stop_codon:yes gene_type:complete
MKITKSQLKQLIKEELESVIEQQTAKQKAGTLPSGDSGERFAVSGKDDLMSKLPGSSGAVESELYDPMLVVTTKVFKKLREAENLLRDIGTGSTKADAMKMRGAIMRASKYVARELGRLQAERSEQMKGMVGQTKSHDTRWRGGDVDAYRTVDSDLITGDDV